VVILLISHIPQCRILMYGAYVRIRPSLGSVRSHSAEYVVCSRRVAMPLHIMGSVGRIRPYTGDYLLGRIRFQWTTGLRLVRFFRLCSVRSEPFPVASGASCSCIWASLLDFLSIFNILFITFELQTFVYLYPCHFTKLSKFYTYV
jgi:hypothetical protein